MIKGELTRRNRGNDWTITQLCFQKTFNRKLKLDLKQKEKREIQLDISNRDFCNTINMRKNQELAYIFSINQKSCDKLVTTYNVYNI